MSRPAKKDFLSEYRWDGSAKINLDEVRCDSGGREKRKDELLKKTAANMDEINSLQEKLYAESRESVLIALQALDAAGKDSVIKRVMATINPQGIDVHSFKSPNAEEQMHDFLWRYHKLLPPRGKMCIFNRSYYEEVLVVAVHEFWKDYNMPKRCFHRGNYIAEKYKEIVGWEKYLWGNGCRVVKIFLHLSKDEQKKRFIERIDRKEKNWKFSANDIKEREYWDKYQKAFESAINNTSTVRCPWYVVPADQKWYARFVVSEILASTLRSIDPRFPSLPESAAAELQSCKERLESE